MESNRYRIDTSSDGMILYANNSQNSDIDHNLNNLTVGKNFLKKKRIIPAALRNSPRGNINFVTLNKRDLI